MRSILFHCSSSTSSLVPIRLIWIGILLLFSVSLVYPHKPQAFAFVKSFQVSSPVVSFRSLPSHKRATLTTTTSKTPFSTLYSGATNCKYDHINNHKRRKTSNQGDISTSVNREDNDRKNLVPFSFALYSSFSSSFDNKNTLDVDSIQYLKNARAELRKLVDFKKLAMDETGEYWKKLPAIIENRIGASKDEEPAKFPSAYEQNIIAFLNKQIFRAKDMIEKRDWELQKGLFIEGQLFCRISDPTKAEFWNHFLKYAAYDIEREQLLTKKEAILGYEPSPFYIKHYGSNNGMNGNDQKPFKKIFYPLEKLIAKLYDRLEYSRRISILMNDHEYTLIMNELHDKINSNKESMQLASKQEKYNEMIEKVEKTGPYNLRTMPWGMLTLFVMFFRWVLSRPGYKMFAENQGVYIPEQSLLERLAPFPGYYTLGIDRLFRSTTDHYKYSLLSSPNANEKFTRHGLSIKKMFGKRASIFEGKPNWLLRSDDSVTFELLNQQYYNRRDEVIAKTRSYWAVIPKEVRIFTTLALASTLLLVGFRQGLKLLQKIRLDTIKQQATIYEKYEFDIETVADDDEDDDGDAAAGDKNYGLQ